MFRAGVQRSFGAGRRAKGTKFRHQWYLFSVYEVLLNLRFQSQCDVIRYISTFGNLVSGKRWS